MVIIGKKSGQLANRLFLFSHFIGNAIEHRYTLINPSFDEYKQYFPSTRNNDFGTHPIYTQLKPDIPYEWTERITDGVSKYAKKSPWHEYMGWPSFDEAFMLNDEGFITKAKRKLIIVDGWLYRDNENLIKHSDKIRRFFTPNHETSQQVREFCNECRMKGDILVGVHIRKGDYQTWQGGKYYFDDDVYIDKMTQLRDFFHRQSKRVVFLLCSNEPLNTQDFGDQQTFLGIGTMLGDLYSLAFCDYIIGPPSTFSMWASFYGEKPLAFIKDPDEKMSLEKFKLRTK